jgi:hypothetical protein
MIPQEIMVESIKYVTSLDLCAKEKLGEEIFVKQPNLLGIVCFLSKLNVPMSKVDEVLFMLLVLYEAFQKRSGLNISLVTEVMIKKASDNNTAMLNYLEKEGMVEGSNLIGKAMAESPNRFVSAFVIGHLNDHGFSTLSEENESCIRAAIVIMDCFIKAVSLPV